MKKGSQASQPSYQCEQCHRSFRAVHHCRAHEIKCKELSERGKRNKAHEPKASPATVPQSITVTEPEREEEPLSTWICHLCGKIFALETTLKYHLKLHEVYQSATIPEPGSGVRNVEESPPSQDTSQPLRCDVCSETFLFDATLKYHMLSHNPPETKQGYEKEMQSILRALQPVSSALPKDTARAGTSSESASQVRARPESASTQESTNTASQGRFSCQLCHQGFVTNSLLNNHIELHFLSRSNPLPEHLKVVSAR